MSDISILAADRLRQTDTRHVILLAQTHINQRRSGVRLVGDKWAWSAAAVAEIRERRQKADSKLHIIVQLSFTFLHVMSYLGKPSERIEMSYTTKNKQLQQVMWQSKLSSDFRLTRALAYEIGC